MSVVVRQSRLIFGPDDAGRPPTDQLTQKKGTGPILPRGSPPAPQRQQNGQDCYQLRVGGGGYFETLYQKTGKPNKR